MKIAAEKTPLQDMQSIISATPEGAEKEQMKRGFYSLSAIEGIAKALSKPAVTYAGELMSLIQQKTADHMEITKIHYTAVGIEATLKDRHDNQLYTIKIEPQYKRA